MWSKVSKCPVLMSKVSKRPGFILSKVSKCPGFMSKVSKCPGFMLSKVSKCPGLMLSKVSKCPGLMLNYGHNADARLWSTFSLLIKSSQVRILAGVVNNFLVQGQLSVLTFISLSVPPPCYRSST